MPFCCERPSAKDEADAERYQRLNDGPKTGRHAGLILPLEQLWMRAPSRYRAGGRRRTRLDGVAEQSVVRQDRVTGRTRR